MGYFVAVYGTLRTGQCNNRIMELARGHKVCDASTRPEFTMFDLGAYPAVVPEGNTTIALEVWQVEDIGPVDRLEGYPQLYNRMRVPTPVGPAWMYYMTDIDTKRHNEVSSGDWVKYTEYANGNCR